MTRTSDCLAALASLGGSGTARQVRDQLRAGGVRLTAGQVSGALQGLSRRGNPPVMLAGRSGAGRGRPGSWRLTRQAASRDNLDTVC